MALKLRCSTQYIGTYYAPSLKKWRAIFGKNTKKLLGDFPTEIEAAKRYNEYVRERDGFNGGFLLSRVNVLPEEHIPLTLGSRPGLTIRPQETLSVKMD
jgi:hypothetical protein